MNTKVPNDLYPRKENLTFDKMLEEFEDTNGVIIIHKLKTDRQHNDPKKKGQNDKQRSTKLVNRNQHFQYLVHDNIKGDKRIEHFFYHQSSN